MTWLLRIVCACVGHSYWGPWRFTAGSDLRERAAICARCGRTK